MKRQQGVVKETQTSMLFKLSEDETLKLVAAFRATRKVQGKDAPSISECLQLAAEVERIVIACAAVERAISGEAMIDLEGPRLVITVPRDHEADLVLTWHRQPEGTVATHVASTRPN